MQAPPEMLDIPTQKKLCDLSMRVQETARKIANQRMTQDELVQIRKEMSQYLSEIRSIISGFGQTSTAAAMGEYVKAFEHGCDKPASTILRGKLIRFECVNCNAKESNRWWKCCPIHTSELDRDVVCQSCKEELHPDSISEMEEQNG